jgi:hypothetical protein
MLILMIVNNIMPLTDQESNDDAADKAFKPKKTPPSSTDESSDSEVVAIEKPGPAKMKQKVTPVSLHFFEVICCILSPCGEVIGTRSQQTNAEEIKGMENVYLLFSH